MSESNVIQMPQPDERRPLECFGVGRVEDNDKALLVIFTRKLTGDEMRFFHEVCRRTAPLMDGASS